MNQDTQDQSPNIQLSLDEVGISDFRAQITVTRGTKIYRYTTNISVVINLPANRKGVHMSRLIESISEILSKKARKEDFFSLEEMSIQVLKELNTRHSFEIGNIVLNFDFFTPRITPVSKKTSMESYQGRLKTDYRHGKISHELSLGTFGSTACPHALANSKNNRTHIQRAYGEVTLKGETSEIPDMEIISKILDQSFSSPTYSLLKSEDEQWVINQMFDNPLFVEDVTRNLLENTASTFINHKLEISAKVTSLESIHKHNVISKGSTTTYTSLNE